MLLYFFIISNSSTGIWKWVFKYDALVLPKFGKIASCDVFKLENLTFDQSLGLCGMKMDLRMWDGVLARTSVGAHSETVRPPRLMSEFVTSLQSMQNEKHGFGGSENHIWEAYKIENSKSCWHKSSEFFWMWVRYDIAQIISKIHSWKMLRYLFMTSNSSTWIWKRVWQERWCWRVEQSLKNRFMCCISLKIWFLTRACLCVVWKWIWEYEIAFRRAHPLARTRKPCARPNWSLSL